MWGAVCDHPLLWDVAGVAVTGAVKWFTNWNSMKRAQNRKQSPGGVWEWCKVCTLSTAIIHLLCLGEVKLCCAMCRMKKHFTKAATQLKQHNNRNYTGQQRGISGSGDVCGIASTRPWRVVMNWTKGTESVSWKNNWNAGEKTARRLK